MSDQPCFALDERDRAELETEARIALDFGDWTLGSLALHFGVAEPVLGAALRGEPVLQADRNRLIDFRTRLPLSASARPQRLLVAADVMSAFVHALFRYATPGGRVALRAFPEHGGGLPILQSFVLGADIADLAAAAASLAQIAADAADPKVFCPPIAAFDPALATASEASLTEAFTLSVELDVAPDAGLARLEAVLGPATVVVASGGIWTDPVTGHHHEKKHAHWRLTEPATGPERDRLKAARAGATRVAGGDASNIPSVHPMRWPGSWHRKGEPRLARIVLIRPDAEIELGYALGALSDVATTIPTVGHRLTNSLPVPTTEKMATNLAAIVSGESYHEPLVSLSAQLSGMGGGSALTEAVLRAAMKAVPEPVRDDRWRDRYSDIARTVETAQGKFGPGVSDDEGHGPPDPAPRQVEIPEKLVQPPGLVGKIASFFSRTARCPQPSLSVLMAIQIVGTAAGRIYSTPTRSGTHLYTLGLAPTGAGKNHPIKMGKRLMRESGLGAHVGPSQYMSYASVFLDLATEPKKLAFIDEAGGYFARITSPKGSPHERAVKDIFRIAWGASFDTLQPNAYADTKRKLSPIEWPSLSVAGFSTPEEFYAACEGQDVFNGFLNRFLVFRTDLRPDEVEPEVSELEAIPDAILDALRVISQPPGVLTVALSDGKRPPKMVRWGSDEAHAAYAEMRKAMEVSEDAALLSRCAEMAVRLATIRAIGNNPSDPAVTVDDMIWGRDLALYSAQLMIADAHDFMADTEHQRRTKLVVRKLRAKGAWVTRSALLRSLKHAFKATELETILSGLKETGEVREREDPTGPQGGRPGKSYRYAG